MVTTFPDRFFNSKIISKARENSALFSDEKRVRNIVKTITYFFVVKLFINSIKSEYKSARYENCFH